MRHKGKEVVYVERGDSSVRWLFWGALLGAGLALMYAPRSGEETRRVVQRRLWKLRAMTEEKFDEIAQQFGGTRDSLRDMDDEDLDEDQPFESRAVSSARRRSSGSSAREELERRLAEARARRRVSGDIEEPLA
jgi:gas vesicle protein